MTVFVAEARPLSREEDAWALEVIEDFGGKGVQSPADMLGMKPGRAPGAPQTAR